MLVRKETVARYKGNRGSMRVVEVRSDFGGVVASVARAEKKMQGKEQREGNISDDAPAASDHGRDGQHVGPAPLLGKRRA